MNVPDIKLSEFSDLELLEAQKSVEKFLKNLKNDLADAKKKGEEKS